MAAMNRQPVGIVDYGMGNLLSVFNAFEMIGAAARICRQPEELAGVERIVLPGVGAFRDCIANLSERGFVEALGDARRTGTPIMGICLGMQVMARRSFENGETEGLGWIPADIRKLTPNEPGLRVPQIGWNEVGHREGSPLFRGLPKSPDLYFVHSYHMVCDDAACVEATCDYGGPVTAAIRHANVVATQFHPEKSQDLGIRILENFLSWNP